MKRFRNRRVAVTGAAGGIGSATARRFAMEGASVECIDIDADRLEQVVESIRKDGANAAATTCDLTDLARTQELVIRVVEERGPLDIVVANAGGSRGEMIPFLELDKESWGQMLDRNLTVTFNTALAFSRHLASRTGQTAIVIISSQLAEVVRPGMAHYAAAKGGIRQLMRSIAVDLAEYNVRVNAVAPGPTMTPGNWDMFHDPEISAEHKRSIPMGRVAQPDEVTGAVLYLASDEASYTTGATVLVDGGYCLI